MRIVYFGSGAFGLPTLKRLVESHEIVLVVTQPDRPAGRHRQLTPTPIGQFAAERGLKTIKPETMREPGLIESIHAAAADAFVVIAYGHKLPADLIGDTFAINLHASLLPKCRGAAPISWAIIRGERETGVSVITLASKMDAGLILAQKKIAIAGDETAGELHDRLAELGPQVVLETLMAKTRGEVKGVPQNEAEVTQAPKLSKADGVVDFTQPAAAVRNRIHGLNPWPGCAVRLDGRSIGVIRAELMVEGRGDAHPGQVLDDHSIACGAGRVRLLEVQPPGKRVMSFSEYCNGHAVAVGSIVQSP